MERWRWHLRPRRLLLQLLRHQRRAVPALSAEPPDGQLGSAALGPLRVPGEPLLHPEGRRLPRHRHRQRPPGRHRRQVGGRRWGPRGPPRPRGHLPLSPSPRGKMVPEELEKEIQRAKAEGAEPFFVCATSGTTVLGAFDPLGAIADICQRHNLWLHVDAAWGGSALLSGKHRHLLDGIERADSVAWNPHKMLTVGQQCSAFLLRDSSGLLQRCHGTGATYLFQRDKFYDVTYDTGDKTPQCGRRVDCLKLWLLWKAIGTQGLARRVERAFAFTRYLAEEMKRRDGFRLVLEPEFINLCFWFVPPSLRGREDDPQYWSKLGKVAPVIKERMMKKGSMLVGYQPHGPHVNFFRQVVTNPVVTRADLDFFLDEIERLGEDLGGTPHPPPHPEPSSDP
ncbi:cysteine sulfinic acid decarboxylase isoform X5 [Cuculus canorus]|uniref:cysteine sulfinic acid decarboxylase isoform X5 n=1 Tax=Cuculus canorus TaxID=55661 RepID=UPI0023AB18D7|nr:cysteine sulfinic acid decarboxylase isoform X5 [Cuculus canorus]